MRPVRAIDWWTVQRAAIHSWAKTDSELKADLEQLGPEPSHNLVYWFDRSGTQRVGPSDQAAFVSTPDANAKPEGPAPRYFYGLALARAGQLKEARSLWAPLAASACRSLAPSWRAMAR